MALFGGRLKVYERQAVVTVEGWLAFKAAPELSKLLVALRAAIDEAFVEKVLNPQGSGMEENDGGGNRDSGVGDGDPGRVGGSRCAKAIRAVEALVMCGSSMCSSHTPLGALPLSVSQHSTTRRMNQIQSPNGNDESTQISNTFSQLSINNEESKMNTYYSTSSSGNSSVQVRKGDWLCPKSGCGVNNFASRMRCFRCNTHSDENVNESRSEKSLQQPAVLVEAGTIGLNVNASGNSSNSSSRRPLKGMESARNNSSDGNISNGFSSSSSSSANANANVPSLVYNRPKGESQSAVSSRLVTLGGGITQAMVGNPHPYQGGVGVASREAWETTGDDRDRGGPEEGGRHASRGRGTGSGRGQGRGRISVGVEELRMSGSQRGRGDRGHRPGRGRQSDVK